MRNKLKFGIWGALAAIFAVSACDLEVANPNQPDRDRAIASASDVESLIGSTYSQFWRTSQNMTDGLSGQMEVTADHNTLSWGNFGARDISEEPRKAYNNSPSFAYAYASEDHWGLNYRAISGASDGLRAIEAGLEIGAGGEDTPRARAFGKFVQGIAYGLLAASYDQAFLVDETTDFVNETLEPVPYQDVMAFAISKLQEAAQIAASNSFSLPVGWINGNAMSSARLARVANSYMARYKAAVARSPSERESAPWGDIMTNVSNGITEDLIIEGNEAGTDPWWDAMKPWLGADAGWNRTDLMHLGQADVSGAYQDWVGSPSSTRNPFNVVTPDERLPSEFEDGARGLYYTYQNSTLLPPGRGTYHLSNYIDHRWEEYQMSCGACWFGPISHMTVREMKLYEAEGRLRTGDVSGAAAIINETRVGNGGLTPVTGTGPVPTEPDGSCVPHKRNSSSAECGDLMDAFQYEHYMEISTLYAGDNYFFARGHGELQTGTVLHWPIPGAELETLQMTIYTFGGAGNPGSAPVVMATPGDLEASLQKVAWDLERLDELDRQMLEEHRRALGQQIPR